MPTKLDRFEDEDVIVVYVPLFVQVQIKVDKREFEKEEGRPPTDEDLTEDAVEVVEAALESANFMGYLHKFGSCSVETYGVYSKDELTEVLIPEVKKLLEEGE